MWRNKGVIMIFTEGNEGELNRGGGYKMQYSLRYMIFEGPQRSSFVHIPVFFKYMSNHAQHISTFTQHFFYNTTQVSSTILVFPDSIYPTTMVLGLEKLYGGISKFSGAGPNRILPDPS